MIFTFQPPFWAGLSGYIAEMGSPLLCASLGIVPTVRHAQAKADGGAPGDVAGTGAGESLPQGRAA